MLFGIGGFSFFRPLLVHSFSCGIHTRKSELRTISVFRLPALW